MSKKTETRPATGHINPFGLRMQPELRQRLETAAKEAGRSLNAEIVARLESSISQPMQGALVDQSISLVLERQLKDMERLQKKLHNILGTPDSAWAKSLKGE